MRPCLEPLLDPAQAPSFEALRAGLVDALPLLDDLALTPQDPEWHAEGDVAIHTALVLEQAHGLARAWSLDGPARLTLLLAALLHDIAKPLTTTRRLLDGRERLIAPRHAQRGRDWLSYRLLELGLAYPTLRAVLALVGEHHTPRRLVRRDAPAGAYHALARRVDARLLHLLVVADTRGRRCPDLEAQLEAPELFRLFCDEYAARGGGAWRPWARALAAALPGAPIERVETALARGLDDLASDLICAPEEALARDMARRDRPGGRLWVTCGPSGVGKSRWVEAHLGDAEPIALDALRQTLTGDAADQRANGQVLQLARERLRAALRAGRDVVWDATCLRRAFRAQVLGLGRDYGAHTTLVVFHAPLAIIHARNARRRARQVPVAVLARQLDGLEWPQVDEADRVLTIGADGDPLHDTRDALRETLRGAAAPQPPPAQARP